MKNGRAFLFLTIFVFGAFMRVSALNLDHDVPNDQALYAGMARDILSGRGFSETMSYKGYDHFLPVLLPVLIAVTSKVTHLPVIESGVLLNLTLGLLICLVIGAMVHTRTQNLQYGFLAGFLGSITWPMIYYSLELYTENLFIFIGLLIFHLSLKFIENKSNLKGWTLSFFMGLLLGLAYLVRAGGLYLSVAVPFNIIFLAGFVGESRYRFPFYLLPKIILMIGVCTIIVFGNALRLQKLNGYFSLSPQIGGNAAVGDLVTNFDLSVLRVDSGMTDLNFKKKIKKDGVLFQKILKNPIGEMQALVDRSFSNCGSLLEPFGISHNSSMAKKTGALIWLLLVSFIFYFLIVLFRLDGGHSRLAIIAPAFGLLLIFEHILSYSLFMVWSRYIDQIIPLSIISIFLIINFLSKSYFNLGPLSKLKTWLSVFFFLAMGLLMLTTVQSSLYFKNQRNRIDTAVGVKINQNYLLDGVEKAMSSMTMSTVYYADGYGFPVPYTEDRPDFLFGFLRNNKINYLTTTKDAGFYILNTGIGVPAYWLLNLFSLATPKAVSILSGFEGYYQIHWEFFPKILRDSSPGLPNRITVNKERRLFAIYAEVNNKSISKYIDDCPWQIVETMNSELQPLTTQCLALDLKGDKRILVGYVLWLSADRDLVYEVLFDDFANPKKVDSFLLR